MNDSITKLPNFKFDPILLIASMHQVERAVGWSENNQIALSCAPDDCTLSLQSAAHGAATCPSRVNGDIVREDCWYDDFHPGFRHTYFYDIWKELRQQIRYAWRMRLMKLRPKGCLSFHEDFYERYHIPIITNDRSFFFVNETNEVPWPVDGVRVPSISTFHLPADGSVYQVDTKKHHTVYNGGRTNRVHLVCSV